ncbi:protein chibby homolog 1 [Fopius arisanus]|uniref:Protein chibby homolog 1 n=1 Tax=Fopius arisanus TaxID=64838 RepID=A0A9R1TCU8_9HYME|nr:PREDICTED: protein chibby homolog 1-like [Fopius arisanus]
MLMNKMPFFTNKFSPKKTPIRKASISLANKDLSPKRIERELGSDIGSIRIRLGEQEATFDGGNWIPETGKVGGTFRENEKLKKEVRRLEEENNLLKIKFDLLLDMITETTVEAEHQKGEIDTLKKQLSRFRK